MPRAARGHDQQSYRVLVVVPVMALLALVLAGGCSDGGSGPVAPKPPVVASLRLTPTSASLLVGRTVQLSATPVDAQGNAVTGRTVAWTSSAVGIASVTSAGVVTGLAPGSATISATADGRSASATITVAPVPVATLDLTAGTTAIRVGGSVQLTAIPRDSAGNALTGRVITWASSDGGVATVSAGRVTGVAPGTATITATSEGRSAAAAIVVSAVPVAAVELTPPSTAIRLGGSVQLTATTRDSAGNVLSGREVLFTSSDPALATVSDSGRVSGLGAGTVTITAASEGQSATATVAVTLRPVAAVELTPESASLQVGGTAQLAATLRDSTGAVLTGREILWQSSDTLVAVVSTSGEVAGRAVGVATITATSEGVSSTALITVIPVPLASLEVTPASASLRTGESVQFTAIARDSAGNELSGREITWSSSDTLIARITTAGLATGVAAGTATMTASAGGLSATAGVTVSLVPVATVEIAPTSADLRVGGTLQLTATPRDSAGNALTGRAISWSTSDPGVADVSAAGLVSGLAPGTATITASSEGQSSTATATVTAVPVDTVEVTPAAAAIDVGATLQLTATPRDSAGNILTGRELLWSSADPAVATVSSTGQVVGFAAGTAAITVSSEGQSATALVTVRPVTDSEAPTLQSLSLAPATIDVSTAPAVVTATLQARDDVAGVKQISVNIRSPSGLQALGAASTAPSSGTRLDGTWQVALTLPAHAEAGEWVITSLALTDMTGNRRTLTTANLQTAGFPVVITVASVSDTQAPTLAAFSITPTSVDVSTERRAVNATLLVRDELAGVKSVFVRIASPSGALSYGATADAPSSGTRADGTWNLVLWVPAYAETGNWRISTVILTDSAGNTRNLSTADLLAAGYPVVVSVSATVSDATAPTLHALSLEPDSVAVGASSAVVRGTLHLRDDVSGVQSVAVQISSPSGNLGYGGASIAPATGNRLDGLWHVDLLIPIYAEIGDWQIIRVIVTDVTGNSRILSTAELQGAGYPVRIKVTL